MRSSSSQGRGVGGAAGEPASGSRGPQPTPIFVLGMGRSGTTWTANLLMQHSAITGVCGRLGIVESVYFSVIEGRFGPLADPRSFVEFVEVMGASAYFRGAGIDKDFLYELRPTTYAGAFRAVMDHYAEQAGATHWVEKTPLHTLCAESIAKHYPDALFIAVERDLRQVLTSRLRIHRAKVETHHEDRWPSRWIWIAKWVAAWHLYRKAIRRLGRRYPDRTMRETYMALRSNPERVARRMCDFLGLPFEPGVASSPYPPNTLFESPDDRLAVVSKAEGVWISILNVAMAPMPGLLLRVAHRIVTYAERRRATLPFFFFRGLPGLLVTRAKDRH